VVEKLYRVAYGWVEKTDIKSEDFRRGVMGCFFVQRDNSTSLGDAVKRAGEIRDAWVEETDVPAHRPVGEIFKRS
jgi:hypothetical protein